MQAEIAAEMDLKWQEVNRKDDDTGLVYRGWVASDGVREFIIIHSPVLGYSLGWCPVNSPNRDGFYEMQEIGVQYDSPEAAMRQCLEHRRRKLGS